MSVSSISTKFKALRVFSLLKREDWSLTIPKLKIVQSRVRLRTTRGQGLRCAVLRPVSLSNSTVQYITVLT